MPERSVIHGDAFAWMDRVAAVPAASVVTSLPDLSELPHLDLAAWKQWFVDAARRVIRWTPRTGVAVFFQSDIRVRGVWIDKSYLILRAAEEERALLLWHKIACRLPPGSEPRGRAAYSHMMCVSHTLYPPRRPGPDVLPDAGPATWSKGMGVEACRLACTWIAENTPSTMIVDPFCGLGAALAVANDIGMDAIGVECEAKRCRTARKLTIADLARSRKSSAP